MRHLERRISAIEGQRKPCQVGIVQIDDKQLQAGVTAAKQLADQEEALGYRVPDETREYLLNTIPEPGCMLISFFTTNED